MISFKRKRSQENGKKGGRKREDGRKERRRKEERFLICTKETYLHKICCTPDWSQASFTSSGSQKTHPYLCFLHPCLYKLTGYQSPSSQFQLAPWLLCSPLALPPCNYPSRSFSCASWLHIGTRSLCDLNNAFPTHNSRYRSRPCLLYSLSWGLHHVSLCSPSTLS